MNHILVLLLPRPGMNTSESRGQVLFTPLLLCLRVASWVFKLRFGPVIVVHVLVLLGITAVSAQQGFVNETLSVADHRIVYDVPEAWERYNYTEGSVVTRFVRALEPRVLGEDDTSTSTAVRASLVFSGSALYYLSPIFPYDVRVDVRVDENQPFTLFLRDNATEARLQDVNSSSSRPSGTHTFLLADNLDGSQDHVVVVSSDLEDATVYTHVGQFIYTTSVTTLPNAPNAASNNNNPDDSLADSTKSKPKLQIIIPIVVIGVLFLLAIIAAFLFWRKRKSREKASVTRQLEARPFPLGVPSLTGDTTPVAGTFTRRRLSKRSSHRRSFPSQNQTRTQPQNNDNNTHPTIPPAPTSPAPSKPTRKRPFFGYARGRPNEITTDESPELPHGGRKLEKQDLSMLLAQPSPHVQRMHGFEPSNAAALDLALANVSSSALGLSAGGGGGSSRHGTATGGMDNRPVGGMDNRPVGGMDNRPMGGSSSGGHGRGTREHHASTVSAGTAEMLVRDIPYLPYLDTLTRSVEEMEVPSGYRLANPDLQSEAAGGLASASSPPPRVPEKKMSDPFKTPLPSRSASMQAGQSGYQSVPIPSHPHPHAPVHRSSTSSTISSPAPTPAAAYRNMHRERDREREYHQRGGSAQHHGQQQGVGSGSSSSHGSRFTESPGLYSTYFPVRDTTASPGRMALSEGIEAVVASESAGAGAMAEREREKERREVAAAAAEWEKQQREAALQKQKPQPMRKTSKRKAVPALHDLDPQLQQPQHQEVSSAPATSSTARAIASLTAGGSSSRPPSRPNSRNRSRVRTGSDVSAMKNDRESEDEDPQQQLQERERYTTTRGRMDGFGMTPPPRPRPPPSPSPPPLAAPPSMHQPQPSLTRRPLPSTPGSPARPLPRLPPASVPAASVPVASGSGSGSGNGNGSGRSLPPSPPPPPSSFNMYNPSSYDPWGPSPTPSSAGYGGSSAGGGDRKGKKKVVAREVKDDPVWYPDHVDVDVGTRGGGLENTYDDYNPYTNTTTGTGSSSGGFGASSSSNNNNNNNNNNSSSTRGGGFGGHSPIPDFYVNDSEPRVEYAALGSVSPSPPPSPPAAASTGIQSSSFTSSQLGLQAPPRPPRRSKTPISDVAHLAGARLT